MPSRLMSKSAAPTAIISMAQQARPNVAGQTLLRRAHLTMSSRRPVRKLCWRSSMPISGRLVGSRPAAADAVDGRLRRPARHARLQRPRRAPRQRAVGDEVHERDEDDSGEDDHLDEPERLDLVEHDGPRIEEDDLDVEDDEDHRHQVETHGEPLRRLEAGHDAGLVGRELGRRGLLLWREHRRRDQREDGEREAQKRQDQDREVLVHCGPFLPCDPFRWHIRRAGQRPWRWAYEALVTAPDTTPPSGASKKAARATKAPAKKAKAQAAES